jgi:aspartate/methionine/tyrosine aminotransferase
MAGWRVGMLCGAAEYIDAVVKVKSNIDSGQFLPIQQAAITALNTGEEWFRRQNDIYLQRRQKVYQLLKQLDCRFAEGGAGMFVWAKLPDVAESAEKFVDDLLHHHHIFIAPGHIFGSNGERYVRVSLCAPASQMAEAIRRLASR